MKNKLIAALLAAAVLSGLILPAAAAEGSEASSSTVIVIRTAEDFLDFADSCVLDSWSLDKQVTLEADLSLEGTGYLPAASFGGIFDGNGHSITGLNITQSIAPAGLFGCLQPTAVVKNLSVSGIVAPGGDCTAIGGIVGENYGRLESCSFSGTVSGKMNTGGIAGSNYGTISQCRTEGSISGDNRTGGIAGCSSGQLLSCENTMSVNTDSVDPTVSLTDISLNLTLDFSRLSEQNTSDAATDTGGIAGYSSGSITDCRNSGSIGYPHIGYNLGGIAGRSCGLLSGCENTGSICGRKDVGGIVGQAEPHIQQILSPDYLETLSRQFEGLSGLVGQIGNHGEKLADNLQVELQKVNGYRDAAAAAVGNLAVSAKETTLNEDALSELRSAVQGMVNTSGNLRSAIGDGAETLTDDINAVTGQISAISRTFALATEDAQQQTISDLSEANLSEILEGRVQSCSNTGSVDADLNTGGIAGIMGLEASADPEDDTPDGSLTQRRRYELKDVVSGCENTGTVTGKRSYAGGICGKMELGLITGCSSFGRIASDSGDYVGGIAGIAGGTVQNCFARCSLSGSCYIGGIVGCGIGQDYQGDSSIVSDCCSMVDIAEAEQFIGAISGENIGVYTGNYFVSDTLAGINRVSYAALAEPVSYEKMQTLQGLPQSLQELTLRFMADGQVLKTVSFQYGDSFDDSIFPEVPPKEGCYARWSTRNLNNLHMDTVTEAEYLPYITALCSEESRTGARPVFFVQGQFQEGDCLTAEPGSTAFLPGENQTLLEHWTLSIPADGLASHTIRYLPAQEEVTVYLLKNGSWITADTQAAGSYLSFCADGADIEVAVVKTASGWNRVPIPAGVCALFLLAGSGVIALRRKVPKQRQAKPPVRKKHLFVWAVTLACLICAAAAVWYHMPRTEIVKTVRICDVLKDYLEQPEKKMGLTVRLQMDNRDTVFCADIAATRIEAHSVSAVSENGIAFYYADGIVFTENGDAFRINAQLPDYSELPGQVFALAGLVDIDSADGVYSITTQGSQAQKIAQLLMPSVHELLPEDMQVTVEIVTEEDSITQIRFSGAGNLTDSVKTPFSLTAVLDVLPPEAVTIPDAVVQSILSGNCSPREVYTEELAALIRAWTQLQQQNPVSAQVQIRASCEMLSVSDDFHYYAWQADGSVIHAADKTGQLLYYSGGKVCSANGSEIYAAAESQADISDWMDILYTAFRNAEFQVRHEASDDVYTVTLSPRGMQELSDRILPQARKLNISYDSGSIRLVLCDEQPQSIQLSCSGSTALGALSAAADLSVTITFTEDPEPPELPEAVVKTLIG